MIVFGLMMGQWAIIALAGGAMSFASGIFVEMYQPKNTDALLMLGLVMVMFGIFGALASLMSLTEVML